MTLDLRKARDLGHLRIAAEELSHTALSIRYDGMTDVVEIEGIRYSGEFFRQFATTMPLNTPIKIMARENGVLTLAKMEPGDPDWNVSAERFVRVPLVSGPSDAMMEPGDPDWHVDGAS